MIIVNIVLYGLDYSWYANCESGENLNSIEDVVLNIIIGYDDVEEQIKLAEIKIILYDQI